MPAPALFAIPDKRFRSVFRDDGQTCGLSNAGTALGNCPQKIAVPGIAGYPAVDFNRRARTGPAYLSKHSLAGPTNVCLKSFVFAEFLSQNRWPLLGNSA